MQKNRSRANHTFCLLSGFVTAEITEQAYAGLGRTHPLLVTHTIAWSHLQAQSAVQSVSVPIGDPVRCPNLPVTGSDSQWSRADYEAA